MYVCVYLSAAYTHVQVFTLACLFGELWIGCFLLVLVFFCHYIVVYARGRHVWQLRRMASIQSSSGRSTIADESFEVGGACVHHMMVM